MPLLKLDTVTSTISQVVAGLEEGILPRIAQNCQWKWTNVDIIDIINMSTLTLAKTRRIAPRKSENLTIYLPTPGYEFFDWSTMFPMWATICQLKGVPGTMVLHSSFSIITMLYTTLAYPEVFNPLTLSTFSNHRWFFQQICFHDFATLKAKQA